MKTTQQTSLSTPRASVVILDKDYQVACKPEEKAALLAAAQELDARMRSIRSQGSLVGSERIAVMAALNLCYELQCLKQDQQQHEQLQAGLERMSAQLESMLSQPPAAPTNTQ